MIIIHHYDLDGQCAAAIVKYKYPDAKTYEMTYGDEIPWGIIKNNDVCIVDFSFELEDMKRALAESQSLYWIDHHIGAIDKLKSIENDILGIRDKEEKFAGCELAWKYIFPHDPMPRVVSLLGRYDTHDYIDDTILPFQYAMRTKDTDPSGNFEFWVDLFTDIDGDSEFDFLNEESLIDSIIEEGGPIEKFVEGRNANFVRDNAVCVNLEGYKFLAVNTYLDNSNALEKFFDPNKWDAMMVFYRKSGGWSVSLYNGDEDAGKVDCAKIAQKFGGGGHFSASNFFCERLPFEV